MVRVEEGVGNDLPGSVPRKIFFVNENPHKLWDSKRGVGLVTQRSVGSFESKM